MVNVVLHCVHIKRKTNNIDKIRRITASSRKEHCECFNLEVVVIVNTRDRPDKSSVIFRSSADSLDIRNSLIKREIRHL